MNRKSTPSGAEIDTNILIAKEKEPIQILGGWLGNGIDNKAIWSKNLDEIDEYFERWGRSNPTIFGRRLIVQMFGGGMSQYLTTVQGMPEHIENLLQKKINQFVWGGKKGTINKNHLSAQLEKGGLNLLDIQAHNEAIDLMWLKTYTYV